MRLQPRGAHAIEASRWKKRHELSTQDQQARAEAKRAAAKATFVAK